jgi:hypothetical protein
MRYIWDGSLITGNKMIDEQHQNLFKAINDLLKTCEEGKGKDELKTSLDFLTDYTIRPNVEFMLGASPLCGDRAIRSNSSGAVQKV